ncbi:branched-chain amino acid ABC transporter permease [Ramlibacter monticola]|uniref:Branched-chain amino acid ABC transporter permease n=1 Tax=Ramlibacter monticola TaxID=1926872 RepID=A0A936Z8Y5_9BURK|nr:branched-chain amino acid ABC transporter permease [Ramlibacter monticola]MBL0394897.1 branched-chain amino acid ABC transporter permease [Ramlibacter monticola]
MGTILFDGIAYGMLLFLISVGLSVTLGMMGFINLAHGVFAMIGGYLLVTLMGKAGIDFFLALPLIFLATAAFSLVLERGLYRQLYRSTHLKQVLLTVGLILVAVAAATYAFGPAQQPVKLPGALAGQVEVLGLELSRYKLFLVAVGIAITLALVFGLERTRFGARIRASVDRQSTAEAMGIHVGRVFQLTLAIGSGLAGLGGALGVNILGLDPHFPLKTLVYFLLVVVVGGAGSIPGTLLAALVLGMADTAGKYYLPEVGAFIIYAAMIALLLAFPHGLLGRRRLA